MRSAASKPRYRRSVLETFSPKYESLYESIWIWWGILHLWMPKSFSIMLGWGQKIVMAWNWNHYQPDSDFSFIPSQSFVCCCTDNYSYNMKVPAFRWAALRPLLLLLQLRQISKSSLCLLYFLCLWMQLGEMLRVWTLVFTLFKKTLILLLLKRQIFKFCSVLGA